MTTSEEYLAHAEECVRLASLTPDELLKPQLLSIRQTYLRTAVKLREQEREKKLH